MSAKKLSAKNEDGFVVIRVEATGNSTSSAIQAELVNISTQCKLPPIGGLFDEMVMHPGGGSSRQFGGMKVQSHKTEEVFSALRSSGFEITFA